MRKCRRVIVVNDYAYVNGGASKVAIASAIALARKGLDVHLFAAIPPADPSLAEVGVTVADLGAHPYTRSDTPLKSSLIGLWDRRAARAFRDFAGAFDPTETIVHAHTFRIALSASVPSMSLDMGFSTLYTAHEYSLGCPYGGFYDYRHRHICALHGLSARCVMTACSEGAYAKKLWWVANQTVYAKVAKLPRRFDRVFFVSERSKEILAPYLGDAVRQTILPNPVDIEREPGARIAPGSPFVFVGSLVRLKDPVTLARAARLANAPVKFVGEGDLAPEIRLENPEAAMAGWLGTHELAEALRGARAIVLPSLSYETYGLVVAEAAACGIGSIVSDACVAADWVTKNGAGLTFEAGNADDLAYKLRLLDDVELARDLGQKAYDAFWSDPPIMGNHLDRLLLAYDEELNLGRAV